MTKRILILSERNSLRSQIAEGFLRLFDHNLVVYSAGTAPDITVYPAAVLLMKESGIDISDAFTKDVKQFMHKVFDVVITIHDEETERKPYFEGSFIKEFSLSVKIPSGRFYTHLEEITSIRQLRDELRVKIRSLYDLEIKPAVLKEIEI